MNHRRLRLPAAMAVMALGGPVLAADPVNADHATPIASIRHDAREFGNSVHDNSVQIGHQVARSVRQARHELTLGMRQAQHTIRHWWDNARDTVARI